MNRTFDSMHRRRNDRRSKRRERNIKPTTGRLGNWTFTNDRPCCRSRCLGGRPSVHLRLLRRVRDHRSGLYGILSKCYEPQKISEVLTSATAAAAEHRHFFELRGNVRLGLAKNVDQLTSRLGVVRGEVCVRGSLHTSTLWDNHINDE